MWRTRAAVAAAMAAVTMLTGDPVRMYLKEIGQRSAADRSAEEIDLAMKIEAGVAAAARARCRLKKQGIELERREKRRLSRVEAGGPRCQAAAHRG